MASPRLWRPSLLRVRTLNTFHLPRPLPHIPSIRHASKIPPSPRTRPPKPNNSSPLPPPLPLPPLPPPHRSAEALEALRAWISLFQNNSYFRAALLVVVGGTLYYWTSHIERVPDANGRKRIMLTPQDVVTRQCIAKYRLMREGFVRSGALIGVDDERCRRIHEVLSKLISGNELDTQARGGRWEVAVVDQRNYDPQYTIIQMVMLPGNKAIFTVPVLAFLQSDDELAHAISYEIAHVLLEHRREYDSRSRLWIPVAWTFLTGNVWAFLGGLPIMLALNSWVYWDLERVHEIEADRLGMKLAVRAGYEPKGAVNFWRRLRGEMGTGRLIACSLSTKFLDERIDAMESMQKEIERE